MTAVDRWPTGSEILRVAYATIRARRPREGGHRMNVRCTPETHAKLLALAAAMGLTAGDALGEAVDKLAAEVLA